MSRILFIDGDAILWRVVEENQEESWWPGSDNTRTAACNVKAAHADFIEQAYALADKAKATAVRIILGPPKREGNFRRNLWPEYKMHRRRSDAPVGLSYVKRVLHELEQDVRQAPPHLEADDLIGMGMTAPDGVQKVCWSPDKDMLQVPGYHLNEEGGLYLISHQDADYQHLYQTLTGDTGDGYPGCKGIGPVKAADILQYDRLDVAEGWRRVVHAYKKAGFDETYALTQARVARILRHGEEPGAWAA